MAKKFNTSVTCNPDIHYMVDVTTMRDNRLPLLSVEHPVHILLEANGSPYTLNVCPQTFRLSKTATIANKKDFIIIRTDLLIVR